jgi:signal transduction histidine kinase/DNA-binding response OmpR family regulator/ABC-type xylose transport system substrate-binding protein
MRHVNHLSRHVTQWIVGSFLILTCLSCHQQEKKRYVIGVSQCSDDEWRDKLNKEIYLEAMFRGNIDIIFRSANDNNAKQAADIADLIKQKVDLMIISPNESAPVTPAVEMAYKSNIPIIISDRKIRSDKYMAYIGPDNYEIGVLAGEYIVKHLQGKGKIVEIKGTEGASPTIERHEGFMSVVHKYKDIEVVYSESGIFLESIGQKKMEEALRLNPHIDLVYAHNDRMAKGAYKAVKTAGREKEMSFVGIDGLAEDGYGVDMVLEGILAVTFVNATGGDKIMDIALNILQHQPFERETILPTTQVDKTNARIMKLQTKYINDQSSKILSLNKAINENITQYTRQQVFLYCAVIILLLLLLYIYLLMSAFKKNKQHNKELSQKNKDIEDKNEQLELQGKQLEEATQSKLYFYTTISHDFLTPLTLIREPIEQLLQSTQTTPEQYDLLAMVKRNTTILYRLVKQLLDFRKYENGKLTLNLSKANLKECIESWSKAFTPSIKRKNIKFSIQIVGDADDYEMSLDYNKIERLFYNLLSNALEFTNIGGAIHVDLYHIWEASHQQVVIKISDTGIGIDAKYIDNIFDRFFKVDNYSSGSGIGLAVAKAFTELHGGDIHVKSEVGKGSTFYVTLPYLNSSSEEEEPTFSLSIKHDDHEGDCIEFGNQTLPVAQRDKPVVLAVDDNLDILNFISNLLQAEYLVLLARDGQHGLKLASQYLPDIVIADVMMPVMDGFELCRRLKSEPITCRIPVILLSALTLSDQKIKGIDCGADIYFEKPFDSSVLMAYVKNLTKSRRESGQIPDLTGSDPSEQFFLEKLYALLDDHLSDGEFNVDVLGQTIGLSRAQLYRKIKEQTGYSPNELFRVYRLQKAKKMMTTTGLGVAEVAYKVGFSSPAYFAKCYHEFYQESPSTYLKRMALRSVD